MWFVLFLPFVLNMIQWRRDLERVETLAAARRKISMDDLISGGAPLVSFLVAAWNEESNLGDCLGSILRLGYPRLEIVLCAGGTDGTGQVAAGFGDPRLILLEQRAGEGKQVSLDRCLDRAGGEIIYLLDADCLLNTAAFARMLYPILHGGEQAVTASPAALVTAQMSDPFAVSQCASRIYTSIHQPEYGAGLVGANSAIRRRTLDQAGGFRPALRAGVDYELGKRLLRDGIRIRYDPEATLLTRFHTRIGAYVLQQARWLRTVAIQGIRFGSYKEAASSVATSLVGFGMLAIPSLMIALWSQVPPMVAHGCWWLWGMAFLHAFLSRVRYVKVAAIRLGIRAPRYTIALQPLFLLIDFVAWSIPLFEYPSKRRRERW